MDANAAKLIKAAKNDIGEDAYLIYPDNRREIPDTVLWGFASACVLEFLKPFIDLKGLGEGARKQVIGLLEEWKRKRGFEEFCRSEGLDVSVAEAMGLMPNPVTPTQAEKGVESLASALKDMGMSAEDAEGLADRLAQTITAASKPGQ